MVFSAFTRAVNSSGVSRFFALVRKASSFRSRCHARSEAKPVFCSRRIRARALATRFPKAALTIRAVVHPAMSFPGFVSLPGHVYGAIKRGRSADRRNCPLSTPRKAHVTTRSALGAWARHTVRARLPALRRGSRQRHGSPWLGFRPGLLGQIG